MKEIKNLKSPEKQYMPDVRWWLAEGLHTDETLKNDIRLLDEAGFGAVEFLAMEEPGADSSIYGWGSEEWVHDSKLMFEETTKRKLGVSATCGTNWSNCNLTTITPDDKAASKELDFAVETLEAGAERTGGIPQCELPMEGVTKQELIAVVAIKQDGQLNGKPCLDKDSAVVLTDQVKEDTLIWTAPTDGTYELFFFYIHGTGQTAAPSVSVSYTVNYLDHYGIDAFKEYWDTVVLTPELRDTIKENGRAMMYMDSLELATFTNGGVLWGYHFLEEFEKRRGYDLTPYLPFVSKKVAGMMDLVFDYRYEMRDPVFAEKLHNDTYQTMTDLYMENMMKPMQEWCHSHNMELRSEISYGLPFEISQPGKYVDGIETESLEFASQIESYRNLAGPAHIYNKIYSSETGATQMNYVMGLDFYTQIIFTQFAAGVTRTVLHGYSSIAGSEEGTQWPGHEGMWPVFSERFGVRQPAYQHYNDWTAMVGRYQMLLRKGNPRMDLGILRLDYHFNNMIMITEDEKELYEHELMRGHEGIYWKDMKLQDNGYTWDYFAPQILEEDFVDYGEGLLMPEGPGYQALVIYQEVLPLATAKKIAAMAEKGLPVVFVNGVTETVRPGVDKIHRKAASMTPSLDGKDQELQELVATMKKLPNVKEIDQQEQTMETLQQLGVYARTAFAAPNKNILTLTRKDGNITYFYAYNMMYTEKEAFDFQVKVAGAGKPYRIDCWNGEVEEEGCYKLEEDATVLNLSLAPGEACLYAIETGVQEKHVTNSDGSKITISENGFAVKMPESRTYTIEISDGTTKELTAEVPEIMELPEWDLEVEDWNAGEKKTIMEDRGLGIVTKEVYYETSKERIAAGKTTLKPWRDIAAVGPDVSGVGYYKTDFELPKEWNESMGAVLHIESTNKNTLAVYVNGKKAGAVDFDKLEVDMTEYLVPGTNEIMVEVSSTLNNRLLARGYFDMVEEVSKMLSSNANNAFEGADPEELEQTINFNISTEVHDYGMTGKTEIHFYQKAQLD